MPGSTTKLPNSDLLDEVRSRTEQALTDAGWDHTDVWSVQAPQRESLPLATASVEETNDSQLAGDKDTSPVAVFVAVRVWSHDHQEVEDAANEVVQQMTSDTSPVSLSGWDIHVLRLNALTPIHSRREDAVLYGNSIQFEIHLEPST